MNALTILDLDPETEAGLRRLAEVHGRSLEGEALEILRWATGANASHDISVDEAKPDEVDWTEPEPGFAPGYGMGTKLRRLMTRNGFAELPPREPLSAPEPVDFSGPDYDR